MEWWDEEEYGAGIPIWKGQPQVYATSSLVKTSVVKLELKAA